MDDGAVTAEQLTRVLATTAFLKSYGLEFAVRSVAPGECTLVVPYRPESDRPGGIINGILIMGAADLVMWLAIITLRGETERWVTSDMKTAFLRSAREEDLSCTARILKPGKRFMYGIVESHGASTGLVAHHVVTYARIA